MLNKKMLIRNFVNGATEGNSSNLIIKGNNLINYNTIIAIRRGNKIFLNSKKYSQTTTRNQNLIRLYSSELIEISDYNELINI